MNGQEFTDRAGIVGAGTLQCCNLLLLCDVRFLGVIQLSLQLCILLLRCLQICLDVGRIFLLHAYISIVTAFVVQTNLDLLHHNHRHNSTACPTLGNLFLVEIFDTGTLN